MKVLVVGYGVEGTQLVNYFLNQRIDITVADQKSSSELSIKNGVKLITGSGYLDNLKNYDLIAFSPGLKFESYQKIQKSKLKTTTQIQLFLENCPAKIIGVTGTNGKGTTATLIYNILKKAGKRVYLAGNIGTGVLSLLPKLKKSDWVVLELSSYQLRDLKISPHIGVILNITSDHLDIHQSQKNYIESKANLIRFQKPGDYAILNGDYSVTKNLSKLTKGNIEYFQRSDLKEKIGLPGEHNLENAAAAKKVAEILGINHKTITQVLKSFKGLEHRLQKVAQINKVTFIDDSISTTPFTAIAALKTFKKPKILILGGSKKSADYSDLAKEIKKDLSVKAVILIGQTGSEIENEFKKVDYSGKTYQGFKNIDQVVKKAFQLAEPGYLILLSPASASFDWFKDYKDRAKKYQEAIKKLNA